MAGYALMRLQIARHTIVHRPALRQAGQPDFASPASGPFKMRGGKIVYTSLDVYIVTEYADGGDLFHLRWATPHSMCGRPSVQMAPEVLLGCCITCSPYWVQQHICLLLMMQIAVCASHDPPAPAAVGDFKSF